MACLASRVKDFYKHAMIVTCPFCQTRFLVPASLFASGPRQMKCAKCKHGWKAEAPEGSDEAVALPAPAPEPAPVATAAPAPQNVPLLTPGVRRVLRTLAMIVAALFLLWFVLDRQHIADELGFMEGVYDSVGLHIYHPGEGLNIESVRSELVYEDGVMKLSVYGKIVNVTSKTLEIPPLRASAIGSDGRVMEDWQIDPSAAKVASGQEAPFHSSINAPKGTVADVNLNFVEKKPDDGQ